MNDLISRKEVLKLPQRKGYAVNGWETYIRVSDIEELPSVQPDEDIIHLQKEQAYMQGYEDGKKSRSGKWLRSGSDIFPYECDQCGDTNERTTPWCPHCGCRMEEGDSDG